MDFDNLLLEILDKFIEGKKVDINAYCKKYPEYQDALISKFNKSLDYRLINWKRNGKSYNFFPFGAVTP